MNQIYAKSLDGGDWVSVPLDEFIEQLAVPMMIIIKTCRFPSLEVINDLLKKERLDYGMSGGLIWEASQVTEIERSKSMEQLSVRYGIEFQENSDTVEYSNFDEWITIGIQEVSNEK